MFKKYKFSGRFGVYFFTRYVSMYGYIPWVQSMALSRVHKMALKSLAVPATSAPVEHMFSSRGTFICATTQGRILKQFAFSLSAMLTCRNVLTCNDESDLN